MVITKLYYPNILVYKYHKWLYKYKCFETCDGGSTNSLSSPKKEVKYHYRDEITLIP